MIKSKTMQPKHVSICLNLPSKDNISSSPNPHHHQQNINGSRLSSVKENTGPDIIPLGNKKKSSKRQLRQSVPNKPLQSPLKNIFPTNLSNRLKAHHNQTYLNFVKNPHHNYTQLSQQNNHTYININQQINSSKKYKSITNKQSSNTFNYQNLLPNIYKISKLNNRNKQKIKQENVNNNTFHTKTHTKTNKQNIQHNKIYHYMKKIKQMRFISQYLTDLQLEGILRQLQITGIIQAKWPLIVVDKVYQYIRKKQWNDPKDQIIRMF